MTTSADHAAALAELDSRLKTVLPEEYQDTYENVQPVSMGSAGLKYAGDGTVAWDQIWGSFCDLAMAGGPPHKGTLLEPASSAEVSTNSERYQEVVDEICRGVTMVTDLPAVMSPIPGWVRLDCYSEEMAGWLLRAIVMENVAARADRRALELPAAPAFKLEKEIKNVITVIAKTCHYWMGHMPRSQKRAIAQLFAKVGAELTLIEPARSADGLRTAAEARQAAEMAERVYRAVGFRASHHRYSGWLGVECPSVHAAVWMMRAMVVSNVLSRREGGALFVPINRDADPTGERVCAVLARVHALAAAKGLT